MTEYFADELVTIHAGDCLDVLATLLDDSVDAVITDPPYGLGFMGKTWDSTFTPGESPMRRHAALDAVNAGASRQGGRQRAGEDYAKRQARDARAYGEWCEQWAAECLRVLKPGGHLLAFGGSRTWHRLAAAIEDAGFEIRDSIAWLYGSGFPKSLDVSKAIDKAAGATREIVSEGAAVKRMIPGADQNKTGSWIKDNGREFVPTVTAPSTEAAQQWAGWGTALKPAFEPIVVGRKSLAGTVAANVLDHGTGALNIDACRVEFAGEADEAESKGKNRHADFGTLPGGNEVYGDYSMIERTNYDPTGRWPTNVVLDETQAAALGDVSRFFPTFHYEPKAAQIERPRDGDTAHPTVKPLDLMRWLVRLVTPRGGLVLDPFLGSGTTAEACVIEGFRCIGIERETEYLPLAVARLSKPIQRDIFGSVG